MCFNIDIIKRLKRVEILLLSIFSKEDKPKVIKKKKIRSLSI